MRGERGRLRGARLWLLSVLLAASRAADVDQSPCWQDASAPECANFAVDAATLAADMTDLCASPLSTGAASGWPAACTLWAECQAGRASGQLCEPLRLIQSACGEYLSLPACQGYLVLCAPLSLVPQCEGSGRITALRSATVYYQDVQAACHANPALAQCSRCSAQSLDGDKVVAQALQANCPNPLGTISSMCVETGGRGSYCANWQQLCNATSSGGIAFPALCQPALAPVAAPSPGPAASYAREDAAKAVAAGAGAGAGDAFATIASDGSFRAGPCYTDPSAPQCAGFVRPNTENQADIRVLCSAMPSMSGCTLWRACSKGAGSGPYCEPFSLLGDLCLDMPGMKGCEGWSALCDTPGSVVAQCTSSRPVPHLVLTGDATRAVLDACSAGHSMPACESCTSRAACPDPLATLSALCLSMPGMSQCSGFAAMCDGEGVAAGFAQLCGSSGGGSSAMMPPMKMWLHQTTWEMILFKEWVPTSTGAYVASCFAVAALAVLVQGLKGFRVSLEGRWIVQRAGPQFCAVPPASTAAPAPDLVAEAPGAGGPAAADDAGVVGGGPSAPCAACTADKEGRAQTFARSSTSSLTSNLGAPLLRRSHRGTARLTLILPARHGGQLQRNVVRACLTLVTVFLDYMLMLIVMTFNIGLIVSAVTGYGLGALAFGHLGERDGGVPGAGGPALAFAAATTEGETLDVEAMGCH